MQETVENSLGRGADRDYFELVHESPTPRRVDYRDEWALWLGFFSVAVVLFALYVWLVVIGSPLAPVAIWALVVLIPVRGLYLWQRQRRMERERHALSPPEPLIVRNPRTGRVGPAEAVAGPLPGRIVRAVRATLLSRAVAAESADPVLEVQQRLQRAAAIEDARYSWRPTPDGVAIELGVCVPRIRRYPMEPELVVRGELRPGPVTTFRAAPDRGSGAFPLVILAAGFLVVGSVVLLTALVSLISGNATDGTRFALVWGTGAVAGGVQQLRRFTLLYECHTRVLQRAFGEDLRQGEAARPPPG
jgi:hypothetical protein